MSFIKSYGLDIAVLIITIVFILYKYFTRNFDYWKKRNVPFRTPVPFFGNFLKVFTFRMAIGPYFSELYTEFNKTPYFGMYILNKPGLVIRNPSLIKSILYQDFDHFTSHVLFCDEKIDPLSSKLLFLAKNPEWKLMRTKITPAFSTGKIKHMFGMINESGEDLKIYINKHMHKDSIELKETCAKYATEIVANCAFGIKANCFEHENAIFRVIGRKLFDYDFKTTVRQLCYFFAPNMAKLFRMPFFDPVATNFIREFTMTTIENRERTKTVRNDIIDVIVKIRSQSTPTDAIKFEGDVVAAQAGQFYTAGFDTVSTTMSFTLYELTVNPSIQNKLRSEIQTVLAKHEEITYEAIQEMKYLNMVIYETLRKYPVLPFLDRMCEADYKLPDSDLVIEKGTQVYIPLYALQNDPDYFSDPERYDPERFSDQNKDNFPSSAYMPFGGGPRGCIGERFGLVTTKMGLVHILSEFELEKSETTPVPIKFVTTGILLASTIGLPIKFKKLNTV